ncbi:MAG TPA: glycoside hydrolase family 18 protein, partial [Pirellulales bacterium]|nr:glycoside hydrolase family 18 protein [Pirellulales bacterium]
MKDSKFVLAACALLIALGGNWARSAEPDTVLPVRGAKEFCVAGYLPDYRLNEVDPVAAESLTDLIYFSIQPSAEGEVQAAKLSAATLEKLQTLKRRGKLRLLVALGGWDRSQGFAKMASNLQTRRKFIANLTAFCRQRHFDGVDFDWEHPANRAEEEAYAALLIETSEAMHRENKIVTIAMAAWQHLEPKAF